MSLQFLIYVPILNYDIFVAFVQCIVYEMQNWHAFKTDITREFWGYHLSLLTKCKDLS